MNNWQQAVVEFVNSHEEDRDKEESLGLHEFEVNKKLSINVAVPEEESKYIELIQYLANNFSCLVIYKNSDEYKEIVEKIENKNTLTISWFEIYYCLHRTEPNRPSLEYMELLNKFNNRHIVVYKGLSLKEEIKNFIFAEAKGAIVLLGQ